MCGKFPQFQNVFSTSCLIISHALIDDLIVAFCGHSILSSGQSKNGLAQLLNKFLNDAKTELGAFLPLSATQVLIERLQQRAKSVLVITSNRSSIFRCISLQYGWRVNSTVILTADIWRNKASICTFIRCSQTFLCTKCVSFKALSVVTSQPPFRTLTGHCTHNTHSSHYCSQFCC